MKGLKALHLLYFVFIGQIGQNKILDSSWQWKFLNAIDNGNICVKKRRWNIAEIKPQPMKYNEKIIELRIKKLVAKILLNASSDRLKCKEYGE